MGEVVGKDENKVVLGFCFNSWHLGPTQ